MNWTGGRLQRHSRNNAGKSLSYTQKQHFAKIRNKLQNGPRAVSPLDFSLLHAARDPCEDRRTQGEGSGLESRPKRQKTLSEYASTAALANRLNAMKPRQVSLGRGTSSELRYGARRIKPVGVESGTRAQYNMPAGTRHGRTPNPSAPSERNYIRNQGHTVGLSSRPESSRRNVFPTTLAGSTSAAKPESLEDKRQSLLRQDDWVCTAVTRPLKISFPGSSSREKVGRRRKISTEDRTRHILPVPLRFRPSIQDGLLPQRSEWEDRSGREDISVRIGGEVHGSQRTTLPGLEEMLSQSQFHSMSSESMLLDREDRLYGAQGQVSMSPHTSLLRADGQRLVPGDALWHSRTNPASISVHSRSSGASHDDGMRVEAFQPKMYHSVEDEDEKSDGELAHYASVYSDDERSQAPSKSPMQNSGHHEQAYTAEEYLPQMTTASAERWIEDRVGFQSGDDSVLDKEGDNLDAGPFRLIFDSTLQHSTSRLSEIGTTSDHNTQAIRSTMAEASDDTKEVVVQDSDEIEWEKLVMLDNPLWTDAPVISSLPKADTFHKLVGLGQENDSVVITPLPGIGRTVWCQSSLQQPADGQRIVTPIDEAPIRGNLTLQTEDEIWMRFLDISGDTEEEDKEHKGLAGGHILRQLGGSDESEISVAHCRPINESILAQDSTTSFTRMIAESSSLSSANFASDTALSHTEGTLEELSSSTKSMEATVNTSPLRLRSDAYISTAATVGTSSPDPLAASTSTAPSVAAATAHSSSSDLLLRSGSWAPHQSNMRIPQSSQVSSPDPLTLTSPSAQIARHRNSQATAMQPPNPQRVLFTKPTPFTGRQVSATAIQDASRESLHLGHTIAGSSSKSKSVPKHAKATPRRGMRKRRDESGVAARTAARSIYSIPSTDSDIEDGSGHEDATKSIEEDDTDLLELSRLDVALIVVRVKLLEFERGTLRLVETHVVLWHRIAWPCHQQHWHVTARKESTAETKGETDRSCYQAVK